MSSKKKIRSKCFTYLETGVDIDKANQLIKDIKEITKETYRPGVVSDIGGFGAFFDIPSHYQQPLLVSGTDGVGTKLKLANLLNQHTTIGIDLVAMCVNDIICHGAEPLFFLDYYATGKLNRQQSIDIIRGIAKGCKLAGAALIGGETAEMPGMYSSNDYDLAGFCVGVVEKNKVIDGHAVQIGDAIIGLASSGPHSNGYSLIRKIVEYTGASYSDSFEGKTLGEILITPTRIYTKSILNLLKNVTIHSCANITGGGLVENIPRCIPQGTQAVIDKNSWERPPIFNWLQEKGNVTEEEMQRSLNLGVGMAVIIPTDMVETALACLKASGEKAWTLGSVQASNHDEPSVIIR